EGLRAGRPGAGLAEGAAGQRLTHPISDRSKGRGRTRHTANRCRRVRPRPLMWGTSGTVKEAVTNGRDSMSRLGESAELLKCSFCGKSQKQVIKLIAGPG